MLLINTFDFIVYTRQNVNLQNIFLICIGNAL